MTWGEVLRHNGWQFLIWIDQGLGGLVSTLLKEEAYADLTLSANAYRWEQDGVRSWPRRWIDRLFFWQQAHCYSSYLYEIERRHLPECMR
ncbi:pseudouridine synthase [Mailhella sp.]